MASKPHAVSMDGFQFTPAAIDIKVGDAVEWSNAADGDWHSATHTVADDKVPLFDSPDIFAGDPPFSFTFDTPGTYEYHCRNHHHMTGTIKVE